VKARQRYALAFGGLLAAALASGSIAPLAAQRGAENAPRILIPTLHARPANLGAQAAAAIRERFGREFTQRTLWVIGENDIRNFLIASGYNPDSSLGMTDLKQLGQQLRADEIVDGTISRSGDSYRLEARYLIPQGGDVLIQPLPAVEAGNIGGLASRLADQVKSARRQLGGVKQCISDARDQKNAEAVAAARRAIAEYPNSTMGRLCAATAFSALQQQDSVLKLAEEVLAIDANNRMALEFAAEGYVRLKQEDKAAQTCARLIGVAPTDARIVERCIGVIVASGQAAKAVPVLNEAVELSPADPTLRRLQWRLLLLTQNWKGAVQAGEELVRLDTAQADTAYFLGQVTAFQNDSNVARATELAARGYQKFPGHGTLGSLYIQLLRQQGQLPQALAVLNRELARNPRLPRGYVQKQQIFQEFAEAQYAAGKADSARVYADSSLASLQAALANGEDTTLVAQLSLTAGNNWYKKANASKASEDARQAIDFLTLSERIASTDESAFLLGASHFTVGQVAYTDAREKKSCEASRTANESFTQAGIYIPKGGRKFPDAAGQLMGYVTQLLPVTQKMQQTYCK
jgi:tetratricopeptide (TPR) repeat protein